MLKHRCCVEMWTQEHLRALGDAVQGKDAAYAALEVRDISVQLCGCPVKIKWRG